MAAVPRERQGAVAARLVALALGLALVLAAAPRLVAALLDLPGDRVAAALARGERVGEAALEGMILSREAALAWWPDAAGERGRGTALVALALREPEPAARAGLLRAATPAVADALRAAPADPYGWLRLAVIRAYGEGDLLTALLALRNSLATGAYEPALARWRLRLFLLLWPGLSAADREAFAQQVRHLWRDDRSALVALAGDPTSAQRLRAALPADQRPAFDALAASRNPA